MNIKIDTLKNGLTVAVASMPQLQSVSINVGVKYGSVDEVPRINGSAHFLEHMLFKGTKKMDWKKQNEETRDIGAYRNAYTNYESTVYQMLCYKGYFKKSLDMISDMMLNSTIPQKELDSERGPIINENLIREDNPSYFVYDYLPKALFKNHPASMPIGGDNERTIKKITRNDLFSIYKNRYTPKNMIAVVYGGIDSNKALRLVSDQFKGFSAKEMPSKRKIATGKQVKRVLSFKRAGTQQARIAIGFKCSQFMKNKAGINEMLSLSVANDILSYRLDEEIRGKRGLAYDTDSYYYVYGTFGFIGAETGIKPDKLAEAKGLILEEFGKLEEGKITKQEVAKTKRKIITTYKMLQENTMRMASAIASSYLTYGDAKLIPSIPKLLPSVTLLDVQRACKKYIDTDNYSMVTLKPKK